MRKFSLIRSSILVVSFISGFALYTHGLNSSFADTSKRYQMRGVTLDRLFRSPSRNRVQNDADEEHVLSVPFYNLSGDWNSTLTLSNQAPNPMVARITLFSLDGQRQDVSSVTLQPHSANVYDISHWISTSAFHKGSLQVRYVGPERVVAGQVKVTDDRRSLIFDEQLNDAEYFKSSRLEAVWWLATQRSKMSIVISNIDGAPLSVKVQLNDPEGLTIGSQRISLRAHEARLLNSTDVLNQHKSLPEFGGITVNHTGTPGAVFVSVLTQDSSTGFSSITELQDPAAAVSSRLDGAGIRVGKAKGEPLHQVALARNVGRADSVLSGRVVYTTRDGNSGVIQLPDVNLSPGETSKIDLGKEIRERLIGGIDAAGLEFTCGGDPGSVVMSAMSISEDKNQVFRVPLVDAAGKSQPTNSGKYHVTLDADSSTLVYLKNVTDETQEFWMSVEYPGGSYALAPKKVEAGRTFVVDVRKMRDDQVPDEDGKKLPRRLRNGYLSWSSRSSKDLKPGEMEQPYNHVMIGRYEQSDMAGEMSSTGSYGCGCQPSYLDSWIEWQLSNGSWTQNASLELYPDETIHLRAREYYQDCGGQAAHTVSAVWGSQNDPAATVDQSTGVVTGKSGGNANILAGWSSAIWYELYDCCEYQSIDPVPYATVKVKYPVSLSISIGSKRTHSGGSITDCNGNSMGGGSYYGYSRLIIYTVKDQDGNTFNRSGYSATEAVFVVSCEPANCSYYEATVPVNSSTGTFCDVQAFFRTIPPPPQQGTYRKLKQFLNITKPGYLWAVRVNCLNQQYDDVTITDTTSNPDASCQ